MQEKLIYLTKKNGVVVLPPQELLNKKIPKIILRDFSDGFTTGGLDSWSAGVQPVRNTRAVLSMVSASDDARVLKGA